MDLGMVIKHLFPEANPKEDYKLWKDTDDEPAYIHEWNLPVSPPTDEEMHTAWQEIQSRPMPEILSSDERLAELEKTVNLLLLGGL